MINPAYILQLVKTKDQALLLQNQLTNLAGNLFTQKKFEESVADTLPYEKKELLLQLLKTYNVDSKNLSQVQTFLQELKQVIQTIPIVTLILAFEPKEALVETISTWFVVQHKKAFLLDIVVDRYLLGGAIISYNGAYYDFSLKKLLENKYKQGQIVLP